METVTLQLKTITPLFLGGAHPNECAELRAPAFKAALRYWYRAIDPAYNQPMRKDGPTWEEYLFGSAGYGMGRFRLVVSRPQTGKWRWHDQREPLDRYDLAFTENRGRPDVKNGLIYLGYTHDLGIKRDGNDRKAIPAGQQIEAVLRFREAPGPQARRAIAAAWWLLGHVGGLGSRSRRGFGTVALQSWQTDDPANPWPEFSDLRIAHGATTPEDWLTAFEVGLKKLKEWYPAARVADHLVLGPTTKFYLARNGYDRGAVSSGSKAPIMEAWEHALNMAGRFMQDFRQRYGLGAGGDYDTVKAHLKGLHPSAPCALAAKPLMAPPTRVAFGLPLAFRYGSMEYDVTPTVTITPDISFQGKDHDRNASPVHIRIIQIGSKCYPFFARFDAPILKAGEQVVGMSPKRKVPCTPPLSLPTPSSANSSILDEFFQQLTDPTKKLTFPPVPW